MKIKTLGLKFDIFCDQKKENPSYRLYINGELIAERTYLVPKEDRFSHYVWHLDYDLRVGGDSENIIVVESLTPGADFRVDNIFVNNKQRKHQHGVFKL